MVKWLAKDQKVVSLNPTQDQIQWCLRFHKKYKNKYRYFEVQYGFRNSDISFLSLKFAS